MPRNTDPTNEIPKLPLGRTGCQVMQFGLGGEEVLRTHGGPAR